jgi:3-methyladenine DNA glycosylase AlkD
VDDNTKQTYQRFFKEEVHCYGVKTAAVEKLAKHYFNEIRHLEKRKVWTLCEQLLASDYCEDAFIAFDWAYRLRPHYQPEDFGRFEYWIQRYVNNWAKCDTLCNHSLGSFLERYPSFVDRLIGWTSSENRWLRRAAAVSLILPARKGKFLPQIFEIADRLLKDRDDLVQKGYGWMLKEASKSHRDEVFRYVMEHRKEMPRTSLRYAIEKMPEELRRRAMEK